MKYSNNDTGVEANYWKVGVALKNAYAAYTRAHPPRNEDDWVRWEQIDALISDLASLLAHTEAAPVLLKNLKPHIIVKRGPRSKTFIPAQYLNISGRGNATVGHLGVDIEIDLPSAMEAAKGRK